MNHIAALNRREAPPFGQILKPPMTKAVSAGENLFYVKEGNSEVARVNFIFPAGKLFQSIPLVAQGVSRMMMDGTKSHSGKALSEAIDFYGSYLSFKSGLDYGEATLHLQSRYWEKVFPLVREIFQESVFPKKEFEVFRENGKAALVQDLERVEVLAGRKFFEVLCGPDHSYGKKSEVGDYENLSPEIFQEFFSKHYFGNFPLVVASGWVDENFLKGLKGYFYGPYKDLVPSDVIKEFTPEKEKFYFLPKKGAVQSAIRVGRIVVKKNHEDYPGLFFLNTVLGGYFGSRLMGNIREDKGFTYGIHSTLQVNRAGGILSISTEVGSEVTKEAVSEIFKEIKRLREDLIGVEEMALVRNYIMGNFLRGMDGPFEVADRFLGLELHGLNYDFYQRFVDTILSISSEKVRELAQRYFREEEFCTVVAGCWD